MASGSSHNAIASDINSSVLPSLFLDHSHLNNGGNCSRDLDNLISMNDSALSQQIEFILQDAPMEQEEDDVGNRLTSGRLVSAASVKIENHPPNTNLSTISASEKYNRPQTSSSFVRNNKTIQVHQQHYQNKHHNSLNGRRVIIQSKQQPGNNRINGKDESKNRNVSDPELNDENLQDIVTETNAGEIEDNTHNLQTAHKQIKLEMPDDFDDDGMEIIRSQQSTELMQQQHSMTQSQPPQLVLPGGSIVSTTARTLTVPVSDTLAQIQHRSMYISNAVGGMTGTTFVRMPAVIGRSPMTVLNVVQQGVGAGAQTTQLILQAAPVSNATTSVVVSSNSAAFQQTSHHPPLQQSQQNPVTNIVATSSSTLTTTQAIQTSPSIISAPSTVVSAITPSSASLSNNNNTTINTTSNMTATITANTSTTTATANINSTIYQCLECVEKFDSNELFDIHRSGHANNMKCAICNMVLKSLKNYEKHCLRCKPYECQICGRIVRFRPNFIKHMRVHTGQQSERHKYKCDVCHKEFMSFEYFKVHKKIHNENVNLTCEICGKVFSALASLRGHSKLHSGVKLHKCDVCGKGFGQRYNLKIHARTHTGDFPFECKICKKKLHTQSSLQTHLQVHQRDQTSKVTTTIKYESQPQTAQSSTTLVKSNKNSNINNNSTTNANTSANISPNNNSTNVTTPATIVKLETQSSFDGLTTSCASGDGSCPFKRQRDDFDDNSVKSDTYHDTRIVSTSDGHIMRASNTTGDSSDESLNITQRKQSSKQQHQQQDPSKILLNAPTRTIVIKNYLQNEQNLVSNTSILTQQQQQQQKNQLQHQTQVIQSNSANINGNTIKSSLQQQLLRKTPIIHSTGDATNLSSALASVVQQSGTPPSLSPSSSSTSCSSTVVITKTCVPLSLASAAIGTSTIRSTRNHQQHNNNQQHNHQHHNNQHSNSGCVVTGSSSISGISTTHLTSNHRTLQQRNNHRNHHRRRHLTDIDDEDDDDDANFHSSNGHNHHFDEDEDDEISSPSLATAAIIKTEPNLYSSGSGDNSNEMLIKEEVMFEDSVAPDSPHSPPSSKFRISNFDSDLVDHHVDLNHSLPPYGNLFEPHSMPDSIPVQLYPDDDDDFRLDHSSLGGLHTTSSSTTDGDFIKKEWSSYGDGSSYSMNGKFDDDSDALCDAANFIYH